MLTVRTQLTAEDQLGVTDSSCTRVACNDLLDSFGHRGCRREEHSGENTPAAPDDLGSELAGNRCSR